MRDDVPSARANFVTYLVCQPVGFPRLFLAAGYRFRNMQRHSGIGAGGAGVQTQCKKF